MYNLSILLVASTALLTTVLGAPLESPKQFGGATTSVGGGAGKIAYKKVPMPAGGKPGEQYFQGPNGVFRRGPCKGASGKTCRLYNKKHLTKAGQKAHRARRAAAAASPGARGSAAAAGGAPGGSAGTAPLGGSGGRGAPPLGGSGGPISGGRAAA